MEIVTLYFALFVGSATLVYWLLPWQIRNWWLLLVSIGFIVTWSWELAGILLVLAGTNYYLARLLVLAQNRDRTLLWLGIFFNIVILLSLKYSDFYTKALIQLFEKLGFGTRADGLILLAPLGLSFFTLQMISYLVDVHKHQMAAEKRWLEFFIFVFYFPKFISGPIERVKTFLPRLIADKKISWEQMRRGAALIFIGVVRKKLLADALNAMIPADAFVQPLNYSAINLVSFLLAYSFAIYNDFAGYSTIVRGVSSLFGIELTNNFNVPFLSRSFSEFWTRWHISLSNWLRDYIYFPLSRYLVRKIPAHDAPVNIILPPLVTMLVSGLWHGLAAGLIIWGVLQGVFLIIERLSKLKGPNLPPNELPKYRQWIGTVLVFSMVTLAWLPFRMDLVTAKRFLAGIILPSHWVGPDWLWLSEVLKGNMLFGGIYGWNIPDPRIAVVLIPAFLLDWLQNRKNDELAFLRWPGWIQVVFYFLVLLAVILASFSDTGQPFVYQGF